MKKITLLVASILLVGSVAKASEIINFSGEAITSRFSIEEPIEFVERGVTFYVFPNGEFDFNTAQSTNSDVLYRNGRRNFNQTYGVPSNGGVKIEHDAKGRVRRIGNVFINYDFDNRIKRIGSVYMSYNRFALSQIGGLRIMYNRRGEIVDMFGSVKGYYNNYQYTNNNCNYDYNTDTESQNNDDIFYKKNDNKVKKEDKK